MRAIITRKWHRGSAAAANSLTVTLLVLLLLQANRWTCTNGIHYTRGVGSFVGGSFEKVVLQGIVRCDACFWIKIKHSQYQIFEFQIVRY